jgi:tRNA dimethylallyltransferase
LSNQVKNTLIVLLGPTASGKTSVGIELAHWLDAEIVSADSRQVYGEMNIGTAKPSQEQLLQVTHHLIGHVSVKDDYNAGRYEKEALEVISGIFETKNRALVVGGSGLYIDALCHGLDELPPADSEFRQTLQQNLELYGMNYLQEELKKCDPEYFGKVDISNPVRLMRALEVFFVTGRPYSSFRSGRKISRNFSVIKIGLNPDREDLINCIDARTDQMMADGLLQEVISLVPFRNCNALNTVGYQELFACLDGECSLEEAVERIKINTRRYAKRQMTWFRKDLEITWFHPEETGKIQEFLSSKPGIFLPDL